MNKARQRAVDRAMALIGELGDGLRKAVPGKAMQWSKLGRARRIAHGWPGGVEGGAPQPGARGRGDRRRRPAGTPLANALGGRTGADREGSAKRVRHANPERASRGGRQPLRTPETGSGGAGVRQFDDHKRRRPAVLVPEPPPAETMICLASDSPSPWTARRRDRPGEALERL